MSYIPNVREKFKTPLFKNTQGAAAEKGINYYWQGYLDEKDAQFLAGFDWAILMVVRNLFDNMDMFEDGEHDISADDVNLSLCEFFEKHPDKLDGFRQCLEGWAEMGRNELAVSMIEGMDDKELEKRMTAAENGEMNCLYDFEFEKETIDSGYVNTNNIAPARKRRHYQPCGRAWVSYSVQSSDCWRTGAFFMSEE